MKLNPLLLITAGAYSIPGLGLTFAPSELVAYIGSPSHPAATWLAQLFGAALLGLASLNWFHRYAEVGGVFGRPVLLTNLVFVVVAFFATLGVWRHQGGVAFLAAVVGLGLLALAFGLRLFQPPSSRGSGAA
ncbi:MAG: hypothetical protein ABI592_08175 [Acidobacteriota bacterium]